MTHQIAVQLAYAAAMIGLTTCLHAVMIVVGRKAVRPLSNREGAAAIVSDTVRLVLISLWLFSAHVIAMWMWAGLYRVVGISPDLEEALYFSMVTYTTLGFGDVLAPQDWRLLTGAASANGLLLLGLSGAVLIDFTERLRRGW